MKTGLEIIADERQRQTNKARWTSEHDDGHTAEELARAAAAYAMPDNYRRLDERYKTPDRWPWDVMDWKPTPDARIRELAIAGALIAAEIDRLQRKAGA